MIKRFILLTLFVCCLPLQALAAPLNPADLQYCAEIKGSLKSGALYQVPLTSEVIQKAAPGFADLRLFDAERRETPFVIIDNIPPFETSETYTLEIIGYDNDAASANVILKMPKKHRPISILNLDLEGTDFKKQVTVSESNDGKTWRLLKEDSIFDFTSQVNLRKTSIALPSTTSQYFRIRLKDYASQPAAQPSMQLTYDGLDFSVQGVMKKDVRIRKVQGSTLTSAEQAPVYDKKMFSPLAPFLDKEGNTTIIVQADLPMDQLALEIANPYYYRTVHVYGSSTGRDDSYQLLANQVIYRFSLSAEKQEENSILEKRIPKQSFYKIVIVNRNNPPLDIKSLTLAWVQQNLYFIALKNGEQHSLCFGNLRLKRPEYDLAQFVNQNTLSQHPFARVELSTIRGSAGGPGGIVWTDGMEKLILKIVVVLLVIGMGVWLFLLLKKSEAKK